MNQGTNVLLPSRQTFPHVPLDPRTNPRLCVSQNDAGVLPTSRGKQSLRGVSNEANRPKKATTIVEEFVSEKNAGKRLLPKSDEGTVLDLLLTPSSKNQDIADAGVLVNEGCAFIVGGSDTTGYTMESAMYLLLSHPQALQRLRKELDDALPSIQDFDLQSVLDLPFLVCPSSALQD